MKDDSMKERALQGLRHSVTGMLSAFLLSILSLLTIAQIPSVEPHQLGITVAWFPYLLVGGTLAAAGAFVTVAHQDVPYERMILSACGLLLLLLGLGFLSKPKYWAVDYGGNISLLMGWITLLGGLVIVGDQIPVSNARVRFIARSLKQTPLAIVLGVPLVVMFAVDGVIAQAIAISLLVSPIPGMIGILLLEFVRSRSKSLGRRLTHLVAAGGGILVLFAIAGHSIGCTDFWDPGPYTVQYGTGQRIHYGSCSNLFQPLLFTAGSLLLILAPLLHRVVPVVGNAIAESQSNQA
jgi:hypothetical protein